MRFLSRLMLGGMVAFCILASPSEAAAQGWELMQAEWQPENGNRQLEGEENSTLDAVVMSWDPMDPPGAAAGYINASSDLGTIGDVGPDGVSDGGRIYGEFYTAFEWSGSGSPGPYHLLAVVDDATVASATGGGPLFAYAQAGTGINDWSLWSAWQFPPDSDSSGTLIDQGSYNIGDNGSCAPYSNVLAGTSPTLTAHSFVGAGAYDAPSSTTQQFLTADANCSISVQTVAD